MGGPAFAEGHKGDRVKTPNPVLVYAVAIVLCAIEVAGLIWWKLTRRGRK